MGLETGTYVGDLVNTNPLGTDQKLQGDDHLRLIKSVLQATFPTADQAFSLLRLNTPANKTGAYTVVAADHGSLINVDASGGAVTIALTAAATLGAKFLTIIKKVDSSVNAVTIDPNGVETVDGAATIDLTDENDVIVLLCDGSNFFKISGALNEAILSAVNTFTKTQIWSKGADIASATTLVLGTDGNYFDVTGTTEITGITVTAGTFFMLQFDGILQFNLSGGDNITTAAGDVLIAFATATDTVQILVYTPINSVALSQCRLTKSGSNLELARFNGSKLTIDGVGEVIPTAGVTLAATGLTIDTDHYIYAYMSSGTMTLEASTTGHSTDTTTGVEIKTGDSTRTLVGMARPITGPVWVDTTDQRFVISYFNRRDIFARNELGSDHSSSSTSYISISGTTVEALTWGDVLYEFLVSGSNNGASGGRLFTRGYIDTIGTFSVPCNSGFASAPTSAYANHPVSGGSEGYHKLEIYGRTVSGTSVWEAKDSDVYTTYTQIATRG